MSEPQPGRPGGGGNSGPRSATAATFMVNDSTLRELRRTWQGLTQDVKNFGAAVGDLKKHERDLERLGAKLSALGVGGAGGRPGGAPGGTGGRAAGMPPVPTPRGPVDVGMPGFGRPPGAVDNMGNTRPSPTPPPGGGGGPAGGSDGRAPNGGDSRFSAGNVAKVAGGAALTGMGLAASYYRQRMDPISDNDLMMNQLAQSSGGGGYSRAGFVAQQKALVGTGKGSVGIGGYQSMEDLNKGVMTTTRSLGGTATTGRSAGVLRQAGSLAGLTPDAGLAGSSQALAGLYSAQSSQRIQAATGTASVGVGGKLTGGTQVYDNILRTVFRGQPITMDMITEGMVPGAPLQRTLDYLIPDPNTQEQFRQYATAKVNLGGSSARVNAALESVKRGKTTADTKRSGLSDSIRGKQNQAGGASARAATEAGVAGKDGLQSGFEKLAIVTDNLTDGFRRLNEASGGRVGGAAGFNSVIGGNQIQGALGAIGGIGGGLFAFSQARDLLARRRGRGGGGGGGGGAGGGGGGSGGGADPGGDVQRVFVVNQCCDGVGGPGGPGTPDVPGGPGGGRASRLGRIARGAARPAATALAGAAAWKGADVLFDGLDKKYGEKDEDGRMGTADRLGKSAATVGKYAAGGAAAGAVFGGPFAPITAPIGAAAGTLVGSGKSIYDWYWGGNKGRSKKPTAQAEDPTTRPFKQSRTGYFSPYDDSAPRMARGGEVSGNHTRDDVSIRATPGELIVPLPVVGRHGGASRLMQMLGFSAGGKVGGRDGSGYAFGGEVTGKTEGMHPEFLRRLKAWSASVGEPYNVGSGARSIKEQQSLYDRWIRRVPGQAKAAKPGSSNHNFGLASDGSRWSKKNPGAFGLVYPMSFEPWHVEPVNAKAMRTGAPATPGEADAAGGKEAQPANGVGGSPQAAWSNRSSAYASELEALASVLSGGGLGAALKSQSSRGVSSTEPNVAGNTAGGVGGAATAAAPSNASGNVKLGQQKAAARGWTGGEWDSLYALWQKESGWRTDASNPNSSARGIPQAMMTAQFGKDWQSSPEAKAFLTDPSRQIDWGLNYIARRYQTPSKAWAHSQKTNWYEKGAYDVIGDEIAQLHSGEMVVPRGQATKLRSMIATSRNAMASSGRQSSRENNRPSVTLTIQAPVTVVGKATPDDARLFLEMVRDEAEQNLMLESAGMG